MIQNIIICVIKLYIKYNILIILYIKYNILIILYNIYYIIILYIKIYIPIKYVYFNILFIFLLSI